MCSTCFMFSSLCFSAFFFIFFFFNATATTEIYTLSLHDALPISPLPSHRWRDDHNSTRDTSSGELRPSRPWQREGRSSDRKSTRLNSSHVKISYAVFCLKKKKKK